MSTARDRRPTWAEVDSGAFRRNVDAIVGRLPAGSRLIAVLKADAYGHGAVELARCCPHDRVAMIAVALHEEAVELRRAGIELPLLILGSLTEEQIANAAAEKMHIGVVGPEELEVACRVAREREVVVHLELDSGMGRMGFVEADLPRLAEMVRGSRRLHIEAIYTHFADAANEEDPFTREQIVRFEHMVRELHHAGITAPRHHLANSAATIRGIVQPGEWVRVGVALYGAEVLDRGGSRLEPLLRWRSEIVRLKEVPAGAPVGYGLTFRAARPSRIATVAVGYADGYNRLLSNKAKVLVRGTRAPVAGLVSMDLTTVDVTDIPDAACGDEVVLLGRQGGDEIPAEELAALTGTISYEVFCRISKRVPRLYR